MNYDKNYRTELPGRPQSRFDSETLISHAVRYESYKVAQSSF